MITTPAFSTFCNRYYDKAKKIADVTIAASIKNNGNIHKSVDIELAKELGIVAGLEKVFTTFNGSKGGFDGYLGTVVRNCVLTELGKQSTEARHANLAATTKKAAVSANKTAGAPERAAGTAILEPHEYMEYSGRFGRKEDLIKDMTDKLKRLSPEDQVILALWMQDSTTYVDKVRDELGLPELSNNAICIRCNKAKNKLRSLMKGARVDYRDIYVPRRADIIDGGAYEVATPGIDRNTVRRNRRAAGASITKGIDYARVGELMIRKISEK